MYQERQLKIRANILIAKASEKSIHSCFDIKIPKTMASVQQARKYQFGPSGCFSKACFLDGQCLPFQLLHILVTIPAYNSTELLTNKHKEAAQKYQMYKDITITQQVTVGETPVSCCQFSVKCHFQSNEELIYQRAFLQD